MSDKGIIVTGSDDDIHAPVNATFREAAKELKRLTEIDKKKGISILKLYKSELTYKGKRHDVFLARCQVRCRSEIDVARFLKQLALQDEPK